MEDGKGVDGDVKSEDKKVNGAAAAGGRQLPAKYMVEDERAAAFDSEAEEENSDDETEELLARARGIANPKSKSEKLGVVDHEQQVFETLSKVVAHTSLGRFASWPRDSGVQAVQKSILH